MSSQTRNYTLFSFSREVTLEKMWIRVGQRDHMYALLAICNAMAVNRSDKAFEDQCTAPEDMNIPTALTNFRRNWLPIKLEWVQCFKSRCFTLGESTNNRLESLNGKIKNVCSQFTSLDAFFADFYSLLPPSITTTSRKVGKFDE